MHRRGEKSDLGRAWRQGMAQGWRARGELALAHRLSPRQTRQQRALLEQPAGSAAFRGAPGTRVRGDEMEHLSSPEKMPQAAHAHMMSTGRVQQVQASPESARAGRADLRCSGRKAMRGGKGVRARRAAHLHRSRRPSTPTAQPPFWPAACGVPPCRAARPRHEPEDRDAMRGGWCPTGNVWFT